MLRRVAFLGVGKMGTPMASNLAKAGHRVTAYDPSPAALEAATSSADISPATSAAAAATDAEFVISMLPTGRHAMDLFLVTKDSAGLLESLSPETTVLDCSTIDATTSRQIAAAAAQRGLGFLDAPVSGGESPPSHGVQF